jgi:tripartite-type tricarboxylate transporter receptor subunit TctC
VASAAADGHTLLFAVIPVIGKDEVAMEADRSLRNLDSVAVLARMPMALVVEERPQVLRVRELVARAKGNPAGITLATLGPFSSSTFAAAEMQRAASVRFLTVEYNGAAAALNAVATRNVEAALVPLPAALPHNGGGKLQIVAVTSSLRHPAVPLVPTMAEAAIAGFSAEGGFGLFTAKGIPAKTLEILRRAAGSVIAEEGWMRLLIVRGLLPPRLPQVS